MGRPNTNGTVASTVIGARSMKPSSSMLRWTATSASSSRPESDSPLIGVPGPSHRRAIFFSMARKAVCAVWRVAVVLMTLRICRKATLRISMDWDSRSPKENQYIHVTLHGLETHVPTIASRSLGCNRGSRSLIASRRALKRLSFAVSDKFRIVPTYSNLTVCRAEWSSR
jgi:hypothetical protein